MAAGVAAAATVTVNPPAGTETNVWAFVTGEDALAINTGATGGTVHLNPNNAHTGGTTLGSGTLVVTQPAKAGQPHEYMDGETFHKWLADQFSKSEKLLRASGLLK